jgi:hypothetical protein
MRFEFERSPSGRYGWNVVLYVAGKHRARWYSTRGVWRGWPKVSRGADENCNRAVTLQLWPLGQLDVWWETHWRTDDDGPCADCLAEWAAS